MRPKIEKKPEKKYFRSPVAVSVHEDVLLDAIAEGKQDLRLVESRSHVVEVFKTGRSISSNSSSTSKLGTSCIQNVKYLLDVKITSVRST